MNIIKHHVDSMNIHVCTGFCRHWGLTGGHGLGGVCDHMNINVKLTMKAYYVPTVHTSCVCFVLTGLFMFSIYVRKITQRSGQSSGHGCVSMPTQYVHRQCFGHKQNCVDEWADTYLYHKQLNHQTYKAFVIFLMCVEKHWKCIWSVHVHVLGCRNSSYLMNCTVF